MITTPKKWVRLAGMAMASIALTIGLTPMAMAHVDGGQTSGFFHGLAHPLGGLDHILAMVGVGLWAAQLGGQARWLLPSAFVCVMAIGGAIGMAGPELPFIEQGILLSDLLVGLVVLVAVRLPILFSGSLVALFALFHGYAHGAEMPVNGLAIPYSFGFMVSTAGLHLLGLGAVAASQLPPLAGLADRLVRFTGGLVAIGGMVLLAQSF